MISIMSDRLVQSSLAVWQWFATRLCAATASTQLQTNTQALASVTTDTMAPVSTQPLPSSMDAYSVDEKSTTQCQIHLGPEGQCSCAADSNPARHRACHQAMLRRLLLPVALLLLAVGATLVISCVSDIDLYDLVNLGAGVSGSPLGKRQSTSSGESSFTEDKREFISRYMAVVFFGNSRAFGQDSVSHCHFRRVIPCTYRGHHAQFLVLQR